MKLKTTLFFLLLTSKVLAQFDIAIDFDNDSIVDKATMINIESGYKLTFSLSSQNNKNHTTETITLGGQKNTLSVSKNILILSSQFMRGENKFKFRYDSALKEVRLIGYDTKNYGNATNDGSGNSSYNLNIGVYEASWNRFDKKLKKLVPYPKIRKKLPMKTYLLQDFNDKMIEELDKVSYDLLPSALK